MFFKEKLLKYLFSRSVIEYAFLGAVALGSIDGLWNLLLQTEETSLFSFVVEWFLFSLVFGIFARVPQKIKLVLVETIVSFPALLFSSVMAIFISMISSTLFCRPPSGSMLPFYFMFLGGYFLFALIQGAFFGLLSNKGGKFTIQFAFLNGIALLLGIMIFGLNENNLFYTFWTSYPPDYGVILFGDVMQFMLVGLIRGLILGGFIGYTNLIKSNNSEKQYESF